MSGLIKNYWNSIQETPEELVGCYPMGHCGRLEAPYRHLFELRHLSKIVHFKKEMNVLEIGCGNGRWVVSLAPLVNSYTGVDFSAHAIGIAKRRAKDVGLNNVLLFEKSIFDFRGDRKYDVIYFSGVTQYLEDEQIMQILNNLKPNISENALIIDRSTINHQAREIRDGEVDSQEYYSIYRTPAEITEIFDSYGFDQTYQKRSYRFMRGAPFINKRYINSGLNILAKLTRPYIYYFLYFFSWLLDSIKPIPFEGGMRSHDFFLFRKKRKS